jgi:transposase
MSQNDIFSHHSNKKWEKPKMNISALGIDIAKNVFQLHGIDEKGKPVLQKKINRDKLPAFMANLPTCKIGMESCGGSNYWARTFQSLGHEVKLISPQFVKPYVKSNKNDANDAEAICEALTRPNMRFVAIKTMEQQDIQAIHRIRSRIIKDRTALVNQMRGLLAEYGIVVAQGISHIRKQLPEIIENTENKLSEYAKKFFNQLLCELRDKIRKWKNTMLKLFK